MVSMLWTVLLKCWQSCLPPFLFEISVFLCHFGWLGSCFVDQAGLKLVVLLPLPTECWVYGYAPLFPFFFLFKFYLKNFPFLYLCESTYHSMCIWRSRGSLWGSWFSPFAICFLGMEIRLLGMAEPNSWYHLTYWVILLASPLPVFDFFFWYLVSCHSAFLLSP